MAQKQHPACKPPSYMSSLSPTAPTITPLNLSLKGNAYPMRGITFFFVERFKVWTSAK